MEPSMKVWAWSALALALTAPAAAASELASLIDLPVAGKVIVPAPPYRDASPHASRAGNPVDVALGVAGPFEGRRQIIVQANEGAESPTASRVTLIRDGLLDDAVRSERWDIDLARTPAGTWETWEIRQVTKAWRCWRGGETAGFAARPCP
jgi:hypothetical protein